MLLQACIVTLCPIAWGNDRVFASIFHVASFWYFFLIVLQKHWQNSECYTDIQLHPQGGVGDFSLGEFYFIFWSAIVVFLEDKTSWMGNFGKENGTLLAR